MLRHVDGIANTNRWRHHGEAVAVLSAGLMSCVLTLRPWPWALVVLLGATALAVLGAKVPARIFVRSLCLPLGLVALSVAGLCLEVRWEPGLSLALSPTGAASAWQVGLRTLGALSVTLLFAFTVPAAEWLRMLARLRVPETLLELLHLTYRSIFVLGEVKSSILRAQRSRLGYEGCVASLRSSALASAAIFVGALERSTRLERGLVARGYEGRLRVLSEPSETRWEHCLLALAVPLSLALAAWLTSASGLGGVG